MAAESIPDDPLALYHAGALARVAALDTSRLDGADIERVVDVCCAQVLAVAAMLGSGAAGEGWGDDIDALAALAAKWELTLDAYRILKRQARRIAE